MSKFLLLGFKKYHLRKISPHDRLREMVVENIFNLMKVSVILALISMGAFIVFFHIIIIIFFRMTLRNNALIDLASVNFILLGQE